MRQLTRFAPVVAVLLLLFIPAAARADTDPMFDKGSFTLHSYVAYADSLRGDDQELGSVAVGGEYYVADRFGLGLEVAGLAVQQDNDQDTYGGGLALLLRYHIVDTEKFTIYIDVSSGPFETASRVPDDGTHFNFLSRGGVGITLPLNDNCAVMGGARYFHLSNARIHGSDQNPGLDGVEGYIGLIWKL